MRYQHQGGSYESKCCYTKLTFFFHQMVGLGLVSVYELIRGSVSAYPALCIRALEALLDILQGQQPEALYSEPTEVIGRCTGFSHYKIFHAFSLFTGQLTSVLIYSLVTVFL